MKYTLQRQDRHSLEWVNVGRFAEESMARHVAMEYDDDVGLRILHTQGTCDQCAIRDARIEELENHNRVLRKYVDTMSKDYMPDTGFTSASAAAKPATRHVVVHCDNDID